MANDKGQRGNALRPGRPMSIEVHQVILEVTRQLLSTKKVGDLTINGIANAAGVSRAAIYRRWSNPREVVLDAFLETVSQDVPDVHHASAEVSLRDYILSFTRFMRGAGGRIISELLGEAQSDVELLALFHDRFLTVRRKHGEAIIRRGIASGEFDKNIDPQIAIDLYAGPIYYRALSKHADLSDNFAEMLANYVCASLRNGTMFSSESRTKG